MQREDVDRLAYYAAMLGIPLGDEHAALRDHHEAVAATLRALLAERDAAFAAGQESMRERAAKKCQWHSDRLVETIRALPIKPRP